MAQYYQIYDPGQITQEVATLPNTAYASIVDSNVGVQFIIQTTDTPAVSQPYVVFEPSSAISAQFGQQPVYLVESAPSEPEQVLTNMQPVVLNHTLQQKVLIPQPNQVQAPVLVNSPRVRGLVSSMPRPQASPAARTSSPVQANVVRSPLVNNRPNQPRVNPAPALARLPRAATQATQATRTASPAPSQPAINGREMVKLEDGRIIPIAEYQQLIALKKAQRALANAQQQVPRVGQTRPMVRPPGRPSYRASSTTTVENPVNQPLLPPPQAPPQAAPSSNQITPSPTARIISPNVNKRLPKILREFTAPPELSEIISRGANEEDFESSIRMFVLLACGEQRLITFTTPKEDCTIQEILEQVGVPLEPTTNIAISEVNQDGINIVVSVGYEDDDDDEEEVDQKVPEPRPASPKPPMMVSQPLTPPREPSPEPEAPKIVPGKMAVCTHCGYLSEDFNKCQRCKRRLPQNIKTVNSPSSLNPGNPNVRKPQISINLKPHPGSALNAIAAAQSPGAPPTVLNKSAPAAVTMRRKVRPKLVEVEPMVVTLSSDDEDDTADQSGTNHDTSGMAETVPVQEPSITDLKEGRVVLNSGYNSVACTTISCRIIRMGSYKFVPTHDVSVNGRELIIKALHSKKKDLLVTVVIARRHILKVMACFQKTLPVLFYYLLPEAATKACSLLGMTAEEGDDFFDPVSENEVVRRLVLLPSSLGPEDRWVLQTIYGTSIEELSISQANSILLKSCPKDVALIAQSLSNRSMGATDSVRQLLIYPPGKGGISINTEDYLCLERDQFLNDVIIDFYLKYLVNETLKEKASKVHVFSTFFYNRLTTKPSRPMRRTHASEFDPSLSPAQKRHARVKNWTKNIDLFEKDYIIIPINENAHWFLAIICFPGWTGTCTFDGVRIKLEPTKKKASNTSKTTVISTQKTSPVAPKEKPPQTLEEDSDKDEAEGDESEFDVEDPEDVPSVANTKTDQVPIKQPCILIFDSLAGASRSRVVATLRDYLTCEYAAKRKEIRTFTKNVIHGACPKIPQQNNYTDCGLYLLQYVEHFFSDPIKDYRIPIKGLKDWFDETVVTRKREDISNIIKDLMIKYKKDISLLPPIMLPTLNGEFVAPDSQTEDEQADGDPSSAEGMETEDDMMDSSSASNHGAEAVSPNTRQNAMSYLKAKRIIKAKADSILEVNKKMRMDE